MVKVRVEKIWKINRITSFKPINQSMIGKYSYRFTKKKKDHIASRKKETEKEIKIILIIV